MARKKLTQAAIKFLQDNPEVAEQLGKIGQTVLRTIKGTEKVVKPITSRKKVGQGKGGGPKKQFTGTEKARSRMYIDPTTGKKYTSYKKALDDIETGVAVHRLTWKKSGQTARKKDIRSDEEKRAALKRSRAKTKQYQTQLHKRLGIKPSKAKEGSKAQKKDMQQVVNILDNETTNMRNLRLAGEKPRGGITGLVKSLEGPQVESPYKLGGKYFRPSTTQARPIQYGIDIQTGAIPQEGRWLEEETIKALGLSRQEEIKRLKALNLFYGRRRATPYDPETKQALPEQLASEAKVRADVPLTGIIGGRDITGRPISQHAAEMSSKERDFVMSTLKGRIPSSTKEQRQQWADRLWYEGEVQLPKGLVDKQTGDDVIQWRIRPEYESKYPVSTPGINEPKWNPNTQQYENLTSQTRFRQDRPAYPKEVVAEEMGLRGRPSQIVNPSLIEGAAVTRPQALEYRPEAAYIPPYLKRGVPKFPAQRGSINLPMAQRAEQTGALTQPLDVTQQRILENLGRSRQSEKLSRLGEEETIRQAGIQARTGVRKDPTLRTFDPTEPLPSTEIIKKVGRTKQTFVDYPTTPAPKATAKQRATEKAKEKINREVVVIRAKKVEFNKLVANGFETPQSLAKRKDYKAWDRKRKALKKTINKKYPEWQEYISDAGGVKVWQGKYVDSFKKGDIITRRSGGQLKKPRGWGIARYRG